MTAITARIASQPVRSGLWHFVRRNPTLVGGAVVLLLVVLAALAAPLVAGDSIAARPVNRLKPPEAGHWGGTDRRGRGGWGGPTIGARVSVMVGLRVTGHGLA